MQNGDLLKLTRQGLYCPAADFYIDPWQPVARAQDLPAGRAVPVKLMGEQFTAYRSETGVPHVVGFRCAHRGAQLSVGWVEGEDIETRALDVLHAGRTTHLEDHAEWLRRIQTPPPANGARPR